MTYYFRSTPNSPLEIEDSTTPKQIVIGVRGVGGVFLKILFFSTL